MPIAVGAVALTAGLAAATFVKAIGTGFLAMPRSPEAEHAVESPMPMLAGMGVLAAACVGLGLVPGAARLGIERRGRRCGPAREADRAAGDRPSAGRGESG